MFYYTVFLTYHQIGKWDAREFDNRFALELIASGIAKGASFYSVKFFNAETTGDGWECQLELYFTDKRKKTSLDMIDLSEEWKQKAGSGKLAAWLSDVSITPHQDEYVHIFNSRANNFNQNNNNN